MNRLIAWQPYQEPEIKKQVMQLDKTLRVLHPEWCDTVDEAETLNPHTIYFDMATLDRRGEREAIESVLFKSGHNKHMLIASFLEQGNPDHVRALLQHWLESDDASVAREWLFHQRVHPNNTMFHEVLNCNTLLSAALHLCPPAPDSDFPKKDQLSGVNDTLSPACQKVVKKPDSMFGRTITLRTEASNEYVKIQSASESEKEFRNQYARIEYLYNHGQSMGLTSTYPEPKGLYRCSVESLGLNREDKQRLAETTGFEPERLVMHFSTPPDQPYDVYINDLQLSPQVAEGKLRNCVNDWGKLWRMGINGPDILSAYHDKETKRAFHFLAEIAPIMTLGVIDEWRQATRYPNAGATGMRDPGDAYRCQELDPDYFYSIAIKPTKTNPENPLEVNRVRLLELARTAWGVLLLWGDRYNTALEQAHTEEDKAKVRSEYDFEPVILPLMSTLFSQAFGMDESTCEEIIKKDGAYDQAIREMRYWMDNVAAPYVSDMRQAKLNREVYPDLPEKMRATNYGNPEWLTDHGYICDAIRDKLKSPKEQMQYANLGSIRAGRNPLLAFNQIVVRLLLGGCMKMYDDKQAEEQESTARPDEYTP